MIPLREVGVVPKHGIEVWSHVAGSVSPASLDLQRAGELKRAQRCADRVLRKFWYATRLSRLTGSSRRSHGSPTDRVRREQPLGRAQWRIRGEPPCRDERKSGRHLPRPPRRTRSISHQRVEISALVLVRRATAGAAAIMREPFRVPIQDRRRSRRSVRSSPSRSAFRTHRRRHSARSSPRSNASSIEFVSQPDPCLDRPAERCSFVVLNGRPMLDLDAGRRLESPVAR